MATARGGIGEELNTLGWCCGAVVPQDMYATILPYLRHPGQNEVPTEIGGDDWLIVLSQTCDVVVDKLSQEPWVEVLWCHRVIKLRPQMANRRSTRHLDFRPDRTRYPDIVLNVHATKDRYFIPRELFAGYAPCKDRTLTDPAVFGLQSWYALRYTRPAWPEEFVKAVSPYREELEGALKILPALSELRVTAPHRRGDKHYVAVFLVLDEQDWKDVKCREDAQVAFLAFISILQKSNAIEVDEESIVVPGNTFSWQQTRVTEEWNFANLTPID